MGGNIKMGMENKNVGEGKTRGKGLSGTWAKKLIVLF